MIDIKLLREEPDRVGKILSKRGGAFNLDEIISIDKERLKLLQKTETLQKERNESSKKIGAIKKAGENVGELQATIRVLGDELKDLEQILKEILSKLREASLAIPNLPDDSVPEGVDETFNVEIRKWGEPNDFSFEPKAHHDIGEALGILDMKRAAKLSGARFSLLMGVGAKLERALINFMLNLHTKEHGYTEVLPPFMVNSATMTGTGQLPKFADDLFKIEGSDYWLIPTAEAPLTNIYAGEIIDGSDLPIKMVAYTPCFRAEAGSYGKDTTGLIRQHQFNKVELVKIVKPENSDEELESLTIDAEKVLQLLELPYRVVTLCGGDLGFSAAKTYDIEVWVPSQNKYREISSCSTFTDFQSRRMNMRYREEKGAKPKLPHTINGSALAVGRTMVAILENFQNEDGSVDIPEVLRHYMGGIEKIRKDA